MEQVLLDQAREPEGDWGEVEDKEGWEEIDQGLAPEGNVSAQTVERLLSIRLVYPAIWLIVQNVVPG